MTLLNYATAIIWDDDPVPPGADRVAGSGSETGDGIAR